MWMKLKSHLSQHPVYSNSYKEIHKDTKYTRNRGYRWHASRELACLPRPVALKILKLVIIYNLSGLYFMSLCGLHFIQ